MSLQLTSLERHNRGALVMLHSARACVSKVGVPLRHDVRDGDSRGRPASLQILHRQPEVKDSGLVRDGMTIQWKEA